MTAQGIRKNEIFYDEKGKEIGKNITGMSGMQPYKGNDTTVKHLLHRTNEDLMTPDKETTEAEMAILLEEARAKIKPVIKIMSDEELDSLMMDMQAMKDHE